MKNKAQTAKNKQPSEVDYERLGKLLQSVYETGYWSTRRMFILSFFKGVITGLGGVIGATIVLALILWLLSFFEQLPLLGPVVDKVQSSVQTTN